MDPPAQPRQACRQLGNLIAVPESRGASTRSPNVRVGVFQMGAARPWLNICISENRDKARPWAQKTGTVAETTIHISILIDTRSIAQGPVTSRLGIIPVTSTPATAAVSGLLAFLAMNPTSAVTPFPFLRPPYPKPLCQLFLG
ncbi:hypothetical protein MN608_07713 [Microdochium nivale]|nr:hypothetical protein MN608_07713 [Microdochium nivale]